MSENLFGTTRVYTDEGDFTHRYFYMLRGCVPPPVKRQKEANAQPAVREQPKSPRQIAMDKARANQNQRSKRKTK